MTDLFARDKAIARLRTRVAGLEQDAEQAKADLDRYEEAVGELNEANIGLQRQVARAEQEIERMKFLVAASSTDGHTVRRTAQKLAALDRVRALHREECLTARAVARGLGHVGLPCSTCAALDTAQQPTA